MFSILRIIHFICFIVFFVSASKKTQGGRGGGGGGRYEDILDMCYSYLESNLCEGNEISVKLLENNNLLCCYFRREVGHVLPLLQTVPREVLRRPGEAMT